MMKKLLCILLSAIFLAGCGGQAIEPTPTPVITPSPTPEVTATPEPTPVVIDESMVEHRLWWEPNPNSGVGMQEGPSNGVAWYYGDTLASRLKDPAYAERYFRLSFTLSKNGVRSVGKQERAKLLEKYGIVTEEEKGTILAKPAQLFAMMENTQYGYEFMLRGPARVEGYSDVFDDEMTDWLEYRTGSYDVFVALIYHSEEDNYFLTYGRREDKVDLTALEPYLGDSGAVIDKLEELAQAFVQRNNIPEAAVEHIYTGLSSEETICTIHMAVNRERALQLAEDPEVRCISAIWY